MATFNKWYLVMEAPGRLCGAVPGPFDFFAGLEMQNPSGRLSKIFHISRKTVKRVLRCFDSASWAILICDQADGEGMASFSLLLKNVFLEP